MNVKLVPKEAFEVFGLECIVKNAKSAVQIPKFWQSCHKNGAYEKLFRALGKPRGEINEDGFARCAIGGISGYRDTGKSTHPYMIGAERTGEAASAGYIIIEIPAATWAVFCGKRAYAPAVGLPQLFKQAYGEWLPSSGYDIASDVNLEVYYDDGAGNYYEEVWVPIIKL